MSKVAVREYTADPIPSFFFRVDFHPSDGLEETSDALKEDRRDESVGVVSFQEVSGIQMELETEDLNEGGVHGVVYKLPKHVKYRNLVLKRAMSSGSSDLLMEWAKKAIENFDIVLYDVRVYLMLPKDDGEGFRSVKEWRFEQAYPVKMQFSDLSAEKNAIVIETLELAYQKMIFKPQIG